jgi:DNA-binding SARP family transcriptional activator
MDFRLLGPIEVIDGDRRLALGGRRQRSVLALLLLHAGQVLSTERLIDDLWGPSRSDAVVKTLHAYVSRLRKELGRDRLLTQPPGYVLRLDEDELDVTRFEQLLAGARELGPEAAARQLREALAMWRGPPLADLAYEPFAQAEIARLEELRLTATEDRIDADLATGRHGELAAELEALVAEHPLRERLRGQLMLALYRSGRQAEALEAYRAARQELVEELGIEPGRPLRELHDAVLRQDTALDLVRPAATETVGPAATGTAPPSPTAPAAQGATPSEPAARGAFVGRDAELDAMLGALDEAIGGRGRLVLLEGEPGIGKSRLAEELSAQARARGAHVLVGRCWEAGGAPAYWPWVQALRAYVREADAGSPAR